MIIQVTEEHIKEGCMCSSDNCPVAIAISERINYKHLVMASYLTITLYPKRPNTFIRHFMTPKDVTHFIKEYDHGRLVKPFSFELPIDEFV